MARCNDCKANKVCDHNRFGFENCENFIPADVVPKSEVFLASSDAMKMLIECHGYALTHDADIKKEVAREIFEEIEFDIHQLMFERDETRAIAIEGVIAELKKKYIGEKE